MKIAWIVDSHISALGINAHARATSDTFVILAASDFPSITSFTKSLLLTNADVIIYSWRYLPLELMSNRRYREFWSTNSKIRFGYLVADFLFSETQMRKREIIVQAISDFALGTTKEIQDYYREEFPRVPTIEIFHDLPDYRTIQTLFNLGLPKAKNPGPNFIWVGNSSWGSRQGRQDHKGYVEFITPLSKILLSRFPESTFKIFDSSRGPHSNKVILKAISEADILFMASKSEGTGLPVLEAMGLGTIPISTRTGIASEILSANFPELLVERNVSSFLHAVSIVLENISKYKDGLLNSYESYLINTKNEVIGNVPILRNTGYQLQFSLVQKIKIILKWKIRYLRARYLL